MAEIEVPTGARTLWDVAKRSASAPAGLLFRIGTDLDQQAAHGGMPLDRAGDSFHHPFPPACGPATGQPVAETPTRSVIAVLDDQPAAADRGGQGE